METKICSRCKITKNIDEFGLKRTNKDGLQSRCRQCRKLETQEDRIRYPNRSKENYAKNKEYRLNHHKEWRKKNPNYYYNYFLKNKDRINEKRRQHYTLNKEFFNLKSRKYREENRDLLNERNREYLKNNREKINEWKRNYRLKNKDRINEYYKEKSKTDIKYRLIRNYRCRIKNYMKFNKISTNTGTLEILGLTAEEFKKYLENKFTEGMSWDNYGTHGWHIDHIIHLSSAKNEEEIKKLCHYTNLQPLWAFDNLSKGCK